MDGGRFLKEVLVLSKGVDTNVSQNHMCVNNGSYLMLISLDYCQRTHRFIEEEFGMDEVVIWQ